MGKITPPKANRKDRGGKQMTNYNERLDKASKLTIRGVIK